MTRDELNAIARALVPILRDHVAVIQAKERGLDGAIGPIGPEGKPGRDGQPGVPGRDGTRGEKGDPGTAGRDGIDGRDGTLEQLTFDVVDDRIGRFKRADGSIVGSFFMAIPLYKGVFADGMSYETGDVVTWAGSAWIATAGTKDKPGAGATAWRLCVKAGREGKEGKAGPEGPKGAKGDPGTPGRDR